LPRPGLRRLCAWLRDDGGSRVPRLLALDRRDTRRGVAASAGRPMAAPALVSRGPVADAVGVPHDPEPPDPHLPGPSGPVPSPLPRVPGALFRPASTIRAGPPEPLAWLYWLFRALYWLVVPLVLIGAVRVVRTLGTLSTPGRRAVELLYVLLACHVVLHTIVI